MLPVPPPALQMVDAAVWAGSLSLRGGDQQIIADSRQSAGIPIGGDETGCRLDWKFGAGFQCRLPVENRNRIDRRIGNKEILTIRRDSKSGRIASPAQLPRSGRVEQHLQAASLC